MRALHPDSGAMACMPQMFIHYRCRFLGFLEAFDEGHSGLSQQAWIQPLSISARPLDESFKLSKALGLRLI